jgi:uncharacterized protein YceK
MRTMLILLTLALVLGGCTVMTQEQKNWVHDKANRSEAFVALMEKDETTREQEQAWIRSQDDSWQLWSQALLTGEAAPSRLFMTDVTLFDQENGPLTANDFTFNKMWGKTNRPDAPQPPDLRRNGG